MSFGRSVVSAVISFTVFLYPLYSLSTESPLFSQPANKSLTTRQVKSWFSKGGTAYDENTASHIPVQNPGGSQFYADKEFSTSYEKYLKRLAHKGMNSSARISVSGSLQDYLKSGAQKIEKNDDSGWSNSDYIPPPERKGLGEHLRAILGKGSKPKSEVEAAQPKKPSGPVNVFGDPIAVAKPKSPQPQIEDPRLQPKMQDDTNNVSGDQAGVLPPSSGGIATVEAAQPKKPSGPVNIFGEPIPVAKPKSPQPQIEDPRLQPTMQDDTNNVSGDQAGVLPPSSGGIAKKSNPLAPFISSKASKPKPDGGIEADLQPPASELPMVASPKLQSESGKGKAGRTQSKLHRGKKPHKKSKLSKDKEHKKTSKSELGSEANLKGAQPKYSPKVGGKILEVQHRDLDELDSPKGGVSSVQGLDWVKMREKAKAIRAQHEGSSPSHQPSSAANKSHALLGELTVGSDSETPQSSSRHALLGDLTVSTDSETPQSSSRHTLLGDLTVGTDSETPQSSSRHTLLGDLTVSTDSETPQSSSRSSSLFGGESAKHEHEPSGIAWLWQQLIGAGSYNDDVTDLPPLNRVGSVHIEDSESAIDYNDGSSLRPEVEVTASINIHDASRAIDPKQEAPVAVNTPASDIALETTDHRESRTPKEVARKQVCSANGTCDDTEGSTSNKYYKNFSRYLNSRR